MTRRSLGRAVRIADAFFQAFRITPTAEERDWFENSIRDELLNFASELVVEERVGKDGRRRTEPRTHPLGLYPILSLKEAREAARKFLADPQKALAQADAGSFKEVAEDFVRRHVEANKLRSQARDRALPEQVRSPLLGAPSVPRTETW